MTGNTRTRGAIEAALPLAESGMAARDAVDSIRTRFDLTESEHESVVAAVTATLDRRDAERNAAAEPILLAMGHTVDAIAFTVVRMRRLCEGPRTPFVYVARGAMINAIRAQAEAVVSAIDDARTLLVGANHDKAERIRNTAIALRVQGEGVRP